MAEPRIQYVTASDGVSIAYADMGEGYPVIYMSGMPWNHIQIQWQLPQYRNWLENVYSRRRMVVYDARGSGLSDRGVPEFSLEAFARDIDAIVERLGLEKFVLAGALASAVETIHYAFHNPERVSHVYIWDGIHDGRAFMELPQVKAFFSMMEHSWAMFVSTIARTIVGWDADASAYEQYEEFIREAVTQEDALRFYFEFLANTDVTPLLSQITQPTLVAHHKNNALPPPETARFIASRIPGSELLLLDGTWRDNDRNIPTINAAIDRLLGDTATATPHEPPVRSAPAQRSPAGGLVTILFTDIEGSTALTQRLGDVRARELFREHERITREALREFGGSEVKSMGGRVYGLVRFGDPGVAVCDCDGARLRGPQRIERLATQHSHWPQHGGAHR